MVLRRGGECDCAASLCFSGNHSGTDILGSARLDAKGVAKESAFSAHVALPSVLETGNNKMICINYPFSAEDEELQQ